MVVYVRKKIIKGNTYYYLVKNDKAKKNIKQTHLAYIGDLKALKEFVEKLQKKLK